MFETILLLLTLLMVWFWQDTLAKREIAVRTGGELAQRCQLQLLDDTVACEKVRLMRDSTGQMRVLRFYHFDVSSDGATRMPCQLQLLGERLHAWHIPPYLQPVH